MKANRESFERRISKDESTTLAGLEYDSHLAGPGGCHVILYYLPDTPAEQLARAEEEARSRFDVVYISRAEIQPEWLEAEEFHADPTPGNWLAAARWIVEHGQARRIDVKTGALIPENKRGGTLLDGFSASAMVQVYDKLNEANKAKLLSMPLPVAHHVVFKVLNQKEKS